MLLLEINNFGASAASYGGGDAFFEIALMLLVAFVLGLLIRHLLGGKSSVDTGDNEWKMKYDGVQGEIGGLNNKISGLNSDKSSLQADLDACKKAKSSIQADLDACRKAKSSIQADLDACRVEKSEMKLAAMAPPPNPDDLKKVEGIGPKIEQLLNKGGVYTWAKLAETEVSYIQDILDKAGPAYKVHKPGTWPAQAKMAAEGKWADLEKWQDELIGGK